MLTIGQIAVRIHQGQADVVRFECAPSGGRILRTATNSSDEVVQKALQRFIDALQIDLSLDGLYPPSESLLASARFSAQAFPDDLITFTEAGRLLYGEDGIPQQTLWGRIDRLSREGHVNVYQVASRRFLSRAEVESLQPA